PAMPSPMSLVAHRATKDMGLSISPPWILFSLAVEAGDGAAVDLFGALKRRRVDRVEEGSALGAARRRDRGDAFVVFRFRDRRDAGMTAAALDRVVFDAVAGIDHVVAAVAHEDVLAGLAEHRVGAAVADQRVGAEGALHVLVGGREVDGVAAGDVRDPGVPGEG